MDTSPGPLTRAARSGWTAAILFLGCTLFVTWPLGRGLGRDVPGDYGDPLYVAWALAWVSRQIGRILTGHLDAIAHFFDANQLHPEPGVLALSDHFVAQALPLAPVYWITGNPILVLELAYLVAYAMCGFCMWLLVREITGSAAAGVLAGVVFAFNEMFIVYELPHLQILSAQWMPLALYALRRYFEHGSRRALAGAVVSLVALNLSAGYYLLMFPPFVLLYVAWELTARGRWRDLATWRELVIAGVAVGMLTAPFLWPYVAAQRRLGFARTVAETTSMAATLEGYLASGPRLFFAYVCALGVLAASATARLTPYRRTLPLVGFALAAGILAWWLSLGPAPAWHGEAYPNLGLYGWAQAWIPGVNAIRVPSRFAVIFVLFLALLSGMGAAYVARIRRWGPAMVVVMAAFTLWLNAPSSFRLNQVVGETEHNPPPAYLTPSPAAPAVYRYLASLPDRTVVAELPFTDLWYNTRYLYFSTFHWKPLVNGFTSFFPPAYIERVRWLVNPVRTPDEAWTALLSGETTHVVVHTGAWNGDYAQQLDRWLMGHGATIHGRFDGAVVYELPAR